jgi:hypothetical protein
MSLVDLQKKVKNKVYYRDSDIINKDKHNKKLDLATDKMAVLPPIQQFGENFDFEKLKKAAESARNITKQKLELKAKKQFKNNKE